MRIASLVPSLTDAVAALGAGEQLVAVTTYCVHGAPEQAERIGGTKNPDVQRLIALRPDVVLANTEENKPEHLERLRAAGITVEETHPRTVRDCVTLVRRLGQVLDAAEAAETAAADILAAIDAAERSAADTPRVMALTLIWRKPWMGAGPNTYIDDLLWTCGFGNVLSGFDEPYPKLDPSYVLGPDVVLLPSEPYAFAEADLSAVADLVGDVPHAFVDGEALTWHGPRTAEAIRTFTALAAERSRAVT